MTVHASASGYLTEEAFWRNYWAGLQLPKLADEGFSFDRSLMRTFRRHVPLGQGRRLLEVGCAPGRWMVWFHRALGYDVEGVEYLDVACAKTRENLAMNQVSGRVHQADFLNWHPLDGPYDAVLSIGFIEHFTDVHTVIDRHVQALRKGGTLILLVPNFQGLNYAFQRVLNHDWLLAHNCALADRRFFTGLSSRHPLKPQWVGYIGGFEPAMLSLPPPGSPREEPGRSKSWLRQCFLRCAGVGLALAHRLRNRLPGTDFLNHAWFSSSLVGFYTRN